MAKEINGRLQKGNIPMKASQFQIDENLQVEPNGLHQVIPQFGDQSLYMADIALVSVQVSSIFTGFV